MNNENKDLFQHSKIILGEYLAKTQWRKEYPLRFSINSVILCGKK
jgi:hypothetical protein